MIKKENLNNTLRVKIKDKNGIYIGRIMRKYKNLLIFYITYSEDKMMGVGSTMNFEIDKFLNLINNKIKGIKCENYIINGCGIIMNTSTINHTDICGMSSKNNNVHLCKKCIKENDNKGRFK